MKSFVCFLMVFASAAVAQDRVSEPFRYEGYSDRAYQSYRTITTYVPLSDGEQLAVDAFVPADGPSDGPFPVILMYTPYSRSNIDPETGAIRDLGSAERGQFFIPHGYAMVAADMRGTGASTGWLQDFMPQLADDGKELIDWIAAQPWCDGNVGMMGDSYLGWSQYATASRRPESLKAIAPGVVPLDGFTGEVAPGGVFLREFFEMFSGYMSLILNNLYLPDYGVRPAKPAVDEDGDGEWRDEIPLDLNKNGNFLDDGYPPTYRDESPRKHLYYNATRAHAEGNYNYLEWASKIRYVDQESPLGFAMYDMSPSGFLPGVIESEIPILNVGGWFDAFSRGSFELYATLQSTNPSKLLMPPSYHDFNTGPFWGHFGYKNNEVLALSLTEHLRFFDRHLRGIENGYDEEPPVLLFVMNGEGWRFEREWPLARAQAREFFLGNGLGLSEVESVAGKDEYTVDLGHSSSYGSNNGNRWKGISLESPDVLPDRREKHAQSLVYTSGALASDMEVTGHPIARLWISSTEDYGDVFVFLEDVAENGESILVTEGGLRADFHQLRDNNRMVLGGKTDINVLPELPWHGYEEADFVDAPFADGAIVEMVIDLAPTSWVFREGHKVRLSVTGADYPTFSLHPELSPSNDPDSEDNRVPTITVHRSADHPSALELPWIPAKTKTANR